MRTFLDFEKPIAELEGKIEELRHLSDSGDQKRVMTPAAALAAGADVLVIGRPIPAAPAPLAAARRIAEEMSGPA